MVAVMSGVLAIVSNPFLLGGPTPLCCADEEYIHAALQHFNPFSALQQTFSLTVRWACEP
jgi:hypothetical protein